MRIKMGVGDKKIINRNIDEYGKYEKPKWLLILKDCFLSNSFAEGPKERFRKI